jgi:hypothetical protein
MDIASYAVNKATALTCGARGDLQAAEIYNIIARNIKKKLPADLRW